MNHHRNKTWHRILGAVSTLCMATTLSAQSVVDFTKAENVGNGIIASLTGNIATIVFTLALIITGFMAAFNKIQWVWFFAVIVGAFFVFGANYIVPALRAALT